MENMENLENYEHHPDRTLKIIALILLLILQTLFLFQNKFFFLVFEKLFGLKDLQVFKGLGLYGISPQDFFHLHTRPVLVIVLIIFVSLDMYIISKIIK